MEFKEVKLEKGQDSRRREMIEEISKGKRILEEGSAPCEGYEKEYFSSDDNCSIEEVSEETN